MTKKKIEPNLKDTLEMINEEIRNEEEVMKVLAIKFHESSEKYNKLRLKQRFMISQIYANSPREKTLEELLIKGFIKEDEYIALGGKIE